uniref:Transcription and mRNA export factor ENY2 n=1 Tax=Moschus moschiferus TaxID=68415 RepID=A0A8C6D2N2_MOSMO
MVVSKMNKDAQMRAAINQKLIETGERERLKELLRAKLIECGWKDQLKAHCKEVIKEKGLEHVTVDDLVAEITPKGRGKEYKLCKRKCGLRHDLFSLLLVQVFFFFFLNKKSTLCKIIWIYLHLLFRKSYSCLPNFLEQLMR